MRTQRSRYSTAALGTPAAAGGPSGFSTIVENSVENPGLSELTLLKILEVSGSAYGEGLNRALFPWFSPQSW
jgi:hypothetical protein